MKQIFIFLLFTLLVFSCENKSEKNCIDESKIKNVPCTKIYDPVCGCDDKNYANPCIAENVGLESWTKGECQ